MGILDQLLDPATFQQRPTATAPGWLAQIAGGQYGATPPGFPQDPMQTNAQLPPNAQPARGILNAPMNIAPPQAPQSQPEPNILDKFGAGIAGFFNGGGSLSGSMNAAAQGFETGVSPRNQTMQFLIKQGIDPQIAPMVARTPALLQGVIQNALGFKAQTDDIKEFEYAKRQGFTGGLEQWMQRKRAGAGEYGMTPIWGTGPDGKPSVLQLGKSGDAKQSVLPPGFNLARDPIKVDGPTGTVILDPQTRQQVGFIPKDVAGAKEQAERGEALAKAKVDLPRIEDNANFMLKAIDDVMADPAREWGTGKSAVSTYIPGTSMWDFGQKVEQLKGKTFLEAFQSLRGGGQITEAEGAKATAAIGRLSTFQTEEGFAQAMKDLREVVTTGVARARKLAGQGGAEAKAPGPAPDPLGLR